MSDGNILGAIFIVPLMIGLAYLYLRNLFKLYCDIKFQKYSIVTLARLIGVPFFFVGIVMGFV